MNERFSWENLKSYVTDTEETETAEPVVPIPQPTPSPGRSYRVNASPYRNYGRPAPERTLGVAPFNFTVPRFPEPEAAPMPVKLVKDWIPDIGLGVLGALSDTTKRLVYDFTPDSMFGREGLKDWDFPRHTPENTAQTIGRIIGSLGGMLPAESPYTMAELASQPGWQQVVTASGFVAGPVATSGTIMGLRGGLPTADRYATPTSAAVLKLQKAIKSGQRRVEMVEEARTEELGKRAATGARAVESIAIKESGGRYTGAPSLRAARTGLGELAGELPTDAHVPLKLGVDDVNELLALVWNGSKAGRGSTAIRFGGKKVDYFDYETNIRALSKVLDGKSLPQRGELARLEKIFGSDLTDGLVGMRDRGNKVFNTFLDAWNVQKALVASVDLSAPGRQGWKLLLSPYSKQYAGAIKAQFKLLDPIFGQHQYNILEKTLMEHEYYEVAKKAGLEIMEMSGKHKGVTRATEDAFVSDWASKIPGVRISERAYNGFLNKLRFDSFYKQMDDWAKAGYKASDEELKELGHLLNWSTGRGSLGPLANNSKLWNAAFFSPRFALSQPQFYAYPVRRMLKGESSRFLGQRDSEVSKIWAKIAVGHVIKGAGILAGFKGAEKAGWLDDVQFEIDPRATDFGKIQLGPIRYDFWGGDAQWAKFITRMIGNIKEGQTKESITDMIIKADRNELMWKFIRSKMSPGASLVNDFAIQKEDFYGNEIRYDRESLSEQAKQRFVFMFAQDIADVMQLENDSFTNIGYALPSFLGVGVQSYETEMDLKNEIALREYGMLYNDLGEEADGFESQIAINGDPLIMNYRQKRREARPRENLNDLWYQGISSHRSRVMELENGSERTVGLLQRIEAGAQGEALDTAIRGFLSDKAASWYANIPAAVEEIQDARLDEKLEIYRDAYWGVPLPIDHKTGIADYYWQATERLRILQEAMDVGVPGENVVLQAPASQNPEIAAVVDDWRKDQEYLRVNFYSKTDDILRERGLWEYYEKYKSSQYDYAMRKAYQPFDEALNDVAFAKQAVRRTDARVEQILFKWGRINNVLHPENAYLLDPDQAVSEIREALQTVR